MIDIHSHILPDIEGGSKSLTESIAITKQAAKDGVTNIIAAPYFDSLQMTKAHDTILSSVRNLNEALKQEAISVQILAGQEVVISDHTLNDLKMNNVITLNENTDYVLLKLESSFSPITVNQQIFELQIAGYKPVIANAEKNEVLQQNPKILYELVKNGVLTLVSAKSLAGKESKKVQQFAEKMLESNLAHFVASYNSRGKDAFLQAAFSRMKKRLGKAKVSQLIENSKAFVNGQAIYIDEPERISYKRKWMFSR